MTLTPTPLARLLATTRAAAARRRRGSILILVVALLLLLLIIGTAFLTTSRTERYAAVQDQVNTQADLLLSGVENLLNAQVVGKLFTAPANVAGANAFRYAPTALARYANTYDSAAGDLYLASRIPEQPAATAVVMAGTIHWPSISLLPTPGASAGQPLVEMDAPDGTRAVLVWAYDTSGSTTYKTGDVVTVLGAQSPLYYTPTSSTFTDPSNPTNAAAWKVVDPKQAFRFVTGATPMFGQTTIALWVYNLLANGQQPTFNPSGGRSSTAAPQPNATFGSTYSQAYAIPAADADGDGAPDSTLTKVPVGQIDGVTYYAAVRVVDGNSAVNASAAWRSDTDLTSSTSAPAAAPYLGMFRSNVGLQQLLLSPTSGAPSELNVLNQIRMTSASATPLADTSQTYPDPPAPSPSTEVLFLNQGDALDSQLTRRPGNPGYVTKTARFAWLGQSFTAALANRFCLSSASLSATPGELALGSELTGVQAVPYTTGSLSNWFTKNFNFTTTNGVITPATGITPSNVTYNAAGMPLRPILVGNNAVSNAVSGHYVNQGKYSSTQTYYYGDWVTCTNGRCYLCVYNGTTNALSGDPSLTVIPPVPQTPPATTAAPLPAPQTVPTTVPANKYWEFVPWTNFPVKASANTATFGQLWASYWNVMWDHPYPPPSPLATGIAPQTVGFAQPPFALPLAAGDTNNNQAGNNEYPAAVAPAPSLEARTFRNSIRDPNTVTPPTTAAAAATMQYMTPGQMMVLRSAAAALNTISLRQASGTTNPPATGLDNVLSRQITIPHDPADPDTTLTDHAYDVMLFGATKQPYISEVYVQMASNPAQSYIGIELCNPYPQAMTLTGWRIALMSRASPTAYQAMTVTPLSPANDSDLSSVTIPAANPTTGVPGVAIIQGGTPAGFTPSAGTTTITSLASGVGTSEYVLLRPRRQDGKLSASNDPNNTYNEVATGTTPDYGELVPVDQIDTSALTGTTGTNYSYRRADSPSGGCAWNFTYPGRYSFNTTTTPYRHAGWAQVDGVGAVTSQQSLGTAKGVFGASTAPATATYQTFPVQIANTDSAGWNQSTVAGPNKFSFGGFARNGDLLQVPYTCGYRVLLQNTSFMTTPPPGTTAATRVVELNSLPMDSAFADAEDSNVQETSAEETATTTVPAAYREQIGRFCPVGDPSVPTNPIPPAPPDYTPNDFRPPLPVTIGGTVVANTNLNNWRYHWTRKLFDFVTVQAPHDDYFPNVDPYNYPGTLPTATANRKAAVANATAAGTSEDTVGVEGLVNINTAPVPVLAAVPFFAAGTDNYTYPGGNAQGSKAINSVDDNADLAKAIVDYRNANGPFKSLYDLYKVPFFKYVNDQMILAAEPNNTTGDFSPNSATGDGVRFDFEERFLLLNRVSNLLTTHSDTFTCYVLLQGYRGVDGGSPTLVVQRRATYLLDRTAVTPTNRAPVVVAAPSN